MIETTLKMVLESRTRPWRSVYEAKTAVIEMRGMTKLVLLLSIPICKSKRETKKRQQRRDEEGNARDASD